MIAYEDVHGMIYGRLEVMSFSHIKEYQSGSKQMFVHCKCSCGVTKTVNLPKLRSGHTKSCGCLVLDVGAARYKDRTGEIVGRLTVMSKADNVNGRVAWNCKCSCGNEITVLASNLKPDESNTTSCGCKHSEVMSDRIGDKAPNWKGGVCFVKDGYALESIGNGKQKGQHILVAEKALGRKLKSGEVVHHRDLDKHNNENSNLLICSRSFHTWLHIRIRVATAKLTRKEVGRIREFLDVGISVKDLCERFSVSSRTIRNIRNRVSWVDINNRGVLI